MQQQTKQTYEFGPFHLDSAKRVLLKDGETVPLTPKTFDTLLALVEASGQLLGKDELMQRLWPDSFVEEGNLTVNISTLRKALGENRGEHRYIVTEPGRGYRFVADVREGVELVVEERAKAHVVIEQEILSRPEPAIVINQQPAILQRLASAVAVRSVRARVLLVAILMASLAMAFFLWQFRRPKLLPANANIHSIAILPFRPLTADTNEEYLKIGVTDTLITRLSNIKPLVVRPLTSVSNFDESAMTALEMAHKLKVDAIVEGSVQKVGDQIRLNIKLSQTQAETPLWTRTYDGKIGDMFKVQDQISNDVVNALGLELSREEKQLLAKHQTTSAEAYELYLKGRALWSQRTPDSVRAAIPFFEQAIAQDNDYARAYAGLADCYTLLGGAIGQYGDERRLQINRARAAAIKAVELDGSLAEVHATLGMIYLHYDWNWPSAETEFKRAIELNSNYATAHVWYSNYLLAMGRFDEGLQMAQRAYDLEPLAPMSGNVARALLFSRRYDEAIEQCRRTLDMPNSTQTYFLLGAAYEQLGRYDEAVAAYQQTLNIPNIGLNAIATLAQGYGKAGNTAEALRILHDLEQRAQQEYVAAFYFAQIYIGLGDKDRAMLWLNKAFDEHLDDLVYLKADITFDSLRDDPRFQNLLRRVGLG